jgi:hypothetical protein
VEKRLKGKKNALKSLKRLKSCRRRNQKKLETKKKKRFKMARNALKRLVMFDQDLSRYVKITLKNILSRFVLLW